jgi:hypothetical protein
MSPQLINQILAMYVFCFLQDTGGLDGRTELLFQVRNPHQYDGDPENPMSPSVGLDHARLVTIG